MSDASKSLHVLLPVQVPRGTAARLGLPQRRLMLAVLQAVLDDFEWTPPGAVGMRPTPRDRRTRLAALAYVESRDRSWPFSFDNICEATGLDGAGIRRALRRHASDELV